MSGKTSPAQLPISMRSFYGVSPPKRSRLHDTNNIRPTFKKLNEKLAQFEKKTFDSNSPELKELDHQPELSAEEASKSLDRDSPLPLKNLGNTCYENSIIQCLFSLNMFMDNFEDSMRDMRQYVVKPLFKSFDVCTEHEQQERNRNTISEDDVSYRIAYAFYRLYKSYTQKRDRLEADNQSVKANLPLQFPSINNDDTNQNPSGSAISESDSTIPHCKSDTNDVIVQSSTESNCNPNNEQQDSTTASIDFTNKTTASTSTITSMADTMSSNLTPIALISSAAAPNEQSEIETRLEDLKSAVGERSSQFNSTHQQDASEFFYHVIDSIQEFYQSLHRTKDEDNPVTKAFELELDYLIRCPKCHHRIMTEPEKIRTLPLALPHVNNDINSYNNEASDAPTPPTSDLGLDSPKSNTSEEHQSDEKENQALVDETVPSDNSGNTVSIAKLELTDKTESVTQSQQSSKQYTLHDALNNYFKDDLLEYSCSQPGCDSKQRSKKCLIRKLPQVLFITLARYSYTGKKSLDEIEAPFELTVPFQENKSPSHSPSAYQDFTDDDNKYELVAVVCHLGSSLNAGHYTSYVYNQNNSSWYSCDDDSITKVQESEVRNDASKSGYCFFYAHKSCLPERPELSHERLQEVGESDSVLQNQGDETDLVSSSGVVDCSVVLTPDASPKSSPTPSIPTHEKSEHNLSVSMKNLDSADFCQSTSTAGLDKKR